MHNTMYLLSHVNCIIICLVNCPEIIIIIALKGIHKRLGLYKVLTHSQGNLEAKGEPRATNTGQIKYRSCLERNSKLLCSYITITSTNCTVAIAYHCNLSLIYLSSSCIINVGLQGNMSYSYTYICSST